MEAILDIIFNLFEGADLSAILGSIEGSLVEYDVSAVLDTVSSFFGGLFAEANTFTPFPFEKGCFFMPFYVLIYTFFTF